MRPQPIAYQIGVVLLFCVMLFGVVLAWGANARLDRRDAEQDEANRPADLELILISPVDCQDCVDGQVLTQNIEAQSVHITDSQILSADSSEATILIETYEIQRLPTVLVRGEYQKEIVRPFFEGLTTRDVDQTLVIEINQPVFFDLASQEPVGLVDITYLTDNSCADCYDPTVHKSILEQTFGLTFEVETTVDRMSQEGRALIERYGIGQTPTVLLSSAALSYAKLMNTWERVGSFEDDGVMVFRSNETLGNVIYYDLETGQTIRPDSLPE